VYAYVAPGGGAVGSAVGVFRGPRLPHPANVNAPGAAASNARRDNAIGRTYARQRQNGAARPNRRA